MSHRRQVFISYSRADAAFCRELRQRLLSMGIRVWMDEFDIPVGTYWPDEIDKGLQASDVVVGVMTPESVESRNVKNEWDWAIANGRDLLLLRLRESIIPHRYISINYIDFVSLDEIAAYDRLARALGVELGLDAVDDCVDGTPQREEPATPLEDGATTTDPPGRPARTAEEFSLFGRGREWQTLQACLSQAMSGAGALVLLSGPAGIGKTSIATAILRDAADNGALALMGCCFELGAVAPHGPWRELVNEAAPAKDDAPFPDDGPAGISSPADLHHRLGGFLSSLASNQPLVLLLDDVQWADPASLDALQHVARLVPELPILLLVTYQSEAPDRPKEADRVVPAFLRQGAASHIELHALDADAVGAWVAARYALPASEEERLVDYLQAHGEGSPFRVQLILRLLEDLGALRLAEGCWTLDLRADAEMPAKLPQLIARRLDCLPEDVHRLLSIAAVVGQQAAMDLVSRVAGVPAADIIAAIDGVIGDDLAQLSDDRQHILFGHALIRSALYHGTVAPRRKVWHRRTAEALLVLDRPAPAEVTYHLEESHDFRVIDWQIKAGDAALMACAPDTAFEHYQKALQYLPPSDASRNQRAWLLVRLAQTRTLVDPTEGLSLLETATDLAQSEDDAALALAIRWHRGALREAMGQGGMLDMVTASNAAEQLPREQRERLTGPFRTLLAPPESGQGNRRVGPLGGRG